MTEEKLSVKWEPSVLTFPVAINKVSVQHLRAFNNSTVTAYTYKVKTTNPKRYSVRPNVGVMFPGARSPREAAPSCLRRARRLNRRGFRSQARKRP